jgi:hypothetical protein
VLERLARLIAFSIAAFGVVVLIGAGWIPDVKPDADAYWLAAHRLREGLPLYAASYSDEIEIYRYAPWFAYAWVPLTYLAPALAYTLWRVLLFAAGMATGALIVRWRTPAALTLALLVVGLLVSNLPAANVTGLIVGGLALTLPSRRFGAVALGVAASLKLFPLLFVAGFVAERRWRDVAISLGVAALLWAHALLFDLSSYPTTFGGVSLYRALPAAWPVAVAAVALVMGGLALRRSRWTWLAAAAAVPLVVPRVWLPDAAYAAVAAAALMAWRQPAAAASGALVEPSR